MRPEMVTHLAACSFCSDAHARGFDDVEFCGEGQKLLAPWRIDANRYRVLLVRPDGTHAANVGPSHPGLFELYGWLEARGVRGGMRRSQELTDAVGEALIAKMREMRW